jgi:hypothetical protein
MRIGRNRRAVLLAQEVFGDAHPDEVEAVLDESLATSWDETQLASAEPEDQDDDERHEDADHHDAVHCERRALEEDDVGEELHDRRTVESPIITSGEGDKPCQSVE